MPEIMHTSSPVEELFVKNVEAKGLSLDNTPAAVQLAITLLGQAAISPFATLLDDLPASARAWDWMECAFSAYAEFCSHTVVIDDGTAPPKDSDTAPE